MLKWRSTREFGSHHQWAKFKFLACCVAGLLAAARPCCSAELPRDPARTINVADFAGKPYLRTMQFPGQGVFDKTDADDGAPVQIASVDQIVNVINSLDPSIHQKVYGLFLNGEQDFRSVVSNIQGKSLTPQQIRTALAPYVTHLKNPSEMNFALDTCTALVLLASGSGTLVVINNDDYFYNVGYEKPVVKSGRTYSAAASRAILDPSDRYYLTEMDSYLRPATPSNTASFYQALFSFLTKSDGTRVGSLDSTGQIVATDFLAIYTAELDRHLMVNLVVTKDPWEIDLGEVTLLTAYGAASGMVMKNGQLTAGTAADYYGQGATGSGIGETRSDFMALAKKITSFETSAQGHPDLVQKIIDLTPIQDPTILTAVDGDVFRRFLVFLSRPEFESDVAGNADALSQAMTNLLLQIQADQGNLSKFISGAP